MTNHNEYIDNYKDGFEDIATELGGLTYNSLTLFSNLLS